MAQTLRSIAADAGFQLTVLRGGESFRLWSKNGCISCRNEVQVKAVLREAMKNKQSEIEVINQPSGAG